MDHSKRSSMARRVSKPVDPKLVESNKMALNSLDPKRRKELEASLGWLFLTDNIKKRTREKIQQSMKTNDKLALLFAIIGVITNIIASSMYIKFSQSTSKFFYDFFYDFFKNYLFFILTFFTKNKKHFY